MESIKKLGIILSEEIKLTPIASSGLIILAIKDELGPFRPIEHLDLENYIKVVEHSLRKRLEKLNINNIDQILKRIISELIQIQSLITLEKI